ncbi:dipicolinic acid synthetase subunit A [Bacillus fonticola]|uniref:dipicolinic acid synthetase subunit A n=1 Tax=Bacillus fonticola TaxID=2728853 RepID=UPI00147448B1|nr:dipicolinic acid synthetase subunit A [Bacillus fonticola]
MLTGIHITVIGGDARQLEIVRKFVEMDARLTLVGFEQLDHAFSGAGKESLEDAPLEETDVIVLPVPGTNANGEVDTIFSHETITLTEEALARTPEHCVVYSGISTDHLEKVTKRANRKLVQLFDRDDVAIYNSIPTVEGTIMMAIQHTDFTIHGAEVVVLGLGRVGMSVARTFANLGARVKVGAHKTEQLARITEMGLTPFHLEDLSKEVETCDLCINTIPAHVVTANAIAKMPTHTLIIDLASKPGGTDFRYAEKRGIKALLAPGLPGIVAPKTAGQILAKVLCQLIDEEAKLRKESS